MGSYSTKVDRKWQERWEKTRLYSFDRSRVDKKLYCLEMFSYPSGAKLHVGHWYNYGVTDSWARMKRMQGYEVFQPMGFDAFGLPAENFAIKTGVHPYDSTMANIATMQEQLKQMGGMFDWDYELSTCEPEYYKWTQWMFLQLYKAGLAYRKEAPVNWCEHCQTVLANEQVIDGCCERCDQEVTRRNLTQWFFKITEYADELLEKLDELDWPEKTKQMQRHWIGKSVGADITFNVIGHEASFTVFTTRADTLLGATYVVLAPEHPLVEQITTPEQQAEVQAYQNEVAKQSELDRLTTTEKTGVFTGAYAEHPLTGVKLPIWIADYVLASYGTGAVMAVPAHDERDFEFAEKFDLPIVRVVRPASDGVDDCLPFTDYGVLVNSGVYDGLTSEAAKERIVAQLAKVGRAEFRTNYRLRDWLVSRQRYWGAPIPIVYCPECGTVPVPESELPVELPYDVEFTPDGKSPLAKAEDFVHTSCPQCGSAAEREVDTLDTFVCSSWYFLRFPDPHNSEVPFDKEWINKMLPVDMYVGGAEHACMHLLYARFFTKALRDLGYLDFDEPFTKLVHQGIILGPDGNRMSKSRGNVVSPDGYIAEFGSDVFRMYLQFGFNYIEGGPWSEDGIRAVARFVDRVERFIDRMVELKAQGGGKTTIDKGEKELNFVRHQSIKGITEDADKFQFNTAISRLMELTNALYRYDNEQDEKNVAFLSEVTDDLVRLMAPFAPHFSEEMWERLGNSYSVFNQAWPEHDPAALEREVVEMAVQVNGRVRDRIEVAADASEEDVRAIALAAEKVQPYLEGVSVRKVIVIPKRIVNIVVG
ncbi:MAG: leucine--tRNA ligase [Firmicutes bacterium]|nr:leucine--tRNA ligase [Bacillota bacterium]